MYDGRRLAATTSIRPLVLLLTLVLGLWCGAGLLLFRVVGSWTERGLFGDMFGAVNALFSGLATAGVIFALVLQRREIVIALAEIARGEKSLRESERMIEQNRTGLLAITRLASLNVLLEHYSREIDRAGRHGLGKLREDYEKRVQKISSDLELAYRECSAEFDGLDENIGGSQ